MNLPASQFSNVNYGAVVYAKSAVAWDHLRGYMGEEAFKKAMHHYYNTWKFRHPGPEDVRKSFEESAGKKLDWFFDDMVKTTKKVDYSVVSYKYKDGKTHVKVKNKGNIAAPVVLTFSTDTTSAKTRETSVSLEGDTTVWEDGFTGTKTFVYNGDMGNVATHNARNNALDIKLHNDRGSERGAAGKRLKLRGLSLLDNREEKNIMLLPWVGGNAGDGFMTGFVIHNRSAFGKKFEYYVAPAYGFRSGDIAGLAGFEYKIFTPKRSWLQYISLGVESSRFHKAMNTGSTLDNEEVQLASLYNRLNPSAVFHFKKKDQSKSFNHSAGIQMRWINTEREMIGYLVDEQTVAVQEKYTAHEVFYQFRKKNVNRTHSGYISFESITEQQLGFQGGLYFPSKFASKLSGTYEYAKRYWRKGFFGAESSFSRCFLGIGVGCGLDGGCYLGV
ncbi:MAG: hypothetical protein JJU02_09325 [Cryomorphaceae bacterium]|nr:hypothetical protein [Cryomorphaceae bacterium]